MITNLIGPDIKLMRERYDEALKLQGVPCIYQYPLMPGTNAQGEGVADAYSDYIETHIFFDGNPKIKTYKRYGWVVENDKNLPFLIHCSFNLLHLQRDCMFRIAGHHAEMPERIFRVTELTCDMQAPDHFICQVVPVYEKQITGRTSQEVAQTFNKSNHFIQQKVDYRGRVVTERPGDK